MNKLKFISLFFVLFISSHANAMVPINVCLTGKIELTLTAYKVAFLNAVNLVLSQSPLNNNIHLKTYFYDSKPLSPIRAYNEMLHDHCSAIIGFEYLSDLLLIVKQQSSNEIPIFTSYASSNDSDKLPKNIFIFAPSYSYQANKMMQFLHKRFGKINNVLIITEIDRMDLLKYKFAYETLFKQEKIHYEKVNFIGNDPQFELKIKKFTASKHYNFVFVFSGAVGSTKIINHLNDHKIVFIGTENFGSSTNQSLYVRLNDKKINSFIIRNIDLLKANKPLTKFMIEYTKKYSIMPSPLSAYTYDAMKIILKTQEKYGLVNTNNILKISYSGITGACMKNKKFYRSNQYVILSIRKNGFVYEK